MARTQARGASYGNLARVPDRGTQDVLRQAMDRISALELALTLVQQQALLSVAGTPISAQGNRIQQVRDPQFGMDAVNYQTLLRVVRNEIALAEEAAAAGAAGDNLGTIGAGSDPPTVALPNLFGDVKAYADAHPAELAASCQDSGGTWDFMDGLIAFLQGIDPRVGYNWKRGVVGDPSQDAVSYYHGVGTPVQDSANVYVVDVIGGHCGPSPTPAWNDVTTPRAAGGWSAFR